MIDNLDVNFVFREVLHASLGEATGAAARSTRTLRAKRDNSVIRSAHVVAFGIRGATVDLLLSDRQTLRIECVADFVDWHLVAEGAFTAPPRVYAEDVVLTLPGERTVTWHPNELFRKRLDIPGIAIAPTETTVFLNVRGHDELMFGQMTDAAGNRLLFFEED
jgi:hypothetical protein